MNRLFLVLLMGLHLSCMGQNESLIDAAIERIIEYDEEERNDQELMRNQLLGYLKHPMNLNRVDKDELNSALFLSFIQKMEIHEHRARYGEFLCKQELQVLAHFDPEFIQLISPFITTSESIATLWSRSLEQGTEHSLRIVFKTDKPNSRGYLGKDPYYLGGPQGIDLAYAGQMGDGLVWGLRMEKDAGEPMISSANGLPDHVGYYMGFRGNGIIQNAILGNFTLNIGQALSMSNAYGPAKSAWITSIKNTGKILAPHRSAAENSSFRGIAVQSRFSKSLSGVFYASSRKRDAYFIEDSSSGPFTYNLNELSGLHRSVYESETKNRLGDKLIGFGIESSGSPFTIGLNAYRRKWDLRVRDPDQAYQIFQFRGKSYTSLSIYYDFVLGQANLFGEVCRSNGKVSQIHGMLMSSGILDLSILFRNYSSGAITLYNQAVSENSRAENEMGLLMGLNYKPSKKLEAMFNADIYRFPWLKYSLDAASYGHEYWMEIHHKPMSGMGVMLRVKKELKEQQLSTSEGRGLFVRSRSNVRLHVSYKCNEQLEFRIRYELNFVKDPKLLRGELIYIEPIIRSMDKSWKVAWRLSLGTMESYDARVYAYETSPSGTYPLFNHYFSGSRNYIFVKKKIRNTDIQFKCSHSHHFRTYEQQYEYMSTGSGSEERLGPNKFTFALQLRFQIR